MNKSDHFLKVLKTVGGCLAAQGHKLILKGAVGFLQCSKVTPNQPWLLLLSCFLLKMIYEILKWLV